MKEDMMKVFRVDKPILAMLHLYGFTPARVQDQEIGRAHV